MTTKIWQSYEEVAQYLLNKLCEHFGLGRIEGKQIVSGKSGTKWEIDAKGVRSNSDAFLIIECRRHTKSRINQESIAALAFRIQDTGAQGGIIVSPLRLQRGAKKLAEFTNIEHVTLDSKSTTSDYILRFLNKIFAGASDSIIATDHIHIHLIRNGKLVEEVKP